ncbi:hypothetical protein EDD65_11336 [Keratinibaculum paraultunense]|uniref:Uncharacterized protein n=1 Tax=Keratinibaculum paraultunense TaxID=1278232 RepID=A0A4R3KRF2_9FIRM|nr:hypothetical protein [Keratinibaculum paraultunense]QQY79738.1 hypothetical protein JL105_11255 [Keratinibaculum paraultunense]TCS86953.1 hypothetical protein EDD65_11336 [Keratinibaculum paraultunense]
MWKKITANLFIILIIFSFSLTGYAASAKTLNIQIAKKNNNDYQVTVPSKNAIATDKKTVLISGKAPKGTSIVIEVYGTTDLTGQNFSLTNLPQNNDYILISKETINAGKIGFAKEVELVSGINKVMVIFKVNGVDTVEKIFYVYDKALAEKAAKNPYLLAPTK